MTEEQSKNQVSLTNVFRAFRYWPRIFQLLWQTKPAYLTGILVLTVLQGVVPVLSLLTTQELVNSIVRSWEAGPKVILWAFAAMIGVTFFGHLVGMYKGYFEKLYETLIANHVRILIMEKSISLSLADFENAEVQDQLKRAQNESGSRPFQVVTQILAIISSLVTLGSSAMVLIVWKWWVAALLMTIPLFSFYSFLRLGQQEFLIMWRRAPHTRKSWYYSYLLTRDNSFKEVKVFQLGDYLVGKLRGIYAEFFGEDNRMLKRRNRITFFFQIINMLLSGAMMMVVLWAAYLREVLIGNVVALLQAVRLTESTSQSVVQGILTLCHSNLYLEQLFAFLDRSSTDLPQVQMETQSVPSIETIEFRRVSFRYPGADQYALRDVSFCLRKGESVAVVGRNGSGKSTMIKLLARLYEEYEGEILINGQCIRQFDREALRRRIGVVFQDFVQYEMKLRENIAFGDIGRIGDDEKLAGAAAQAGIGPLLERLPQRLDTQLGRMFDNGQQLSGGQWQRIAIARAFLREADVLVLDEPSSFLDPQAEADVFAKFHELVRDRIGLFISHRYSAVRYSDRILVFEQGRVVEQGDHQELMSQNGRYAKLYNLQMSGVQKEQAAREEVSAS
jgi:ABC-type multidrug transport system fused ATPase/permease subunit